MAVAIAVIVVVVLEAVAEEVIHSVTRISKMAVLILALISVASVAPVAELTYWGSVVRSVMRCDLISRRKPELLTVVSLVMALRIVSELVFPLMLKLFTPAVA